MQIVSSLKWLTIAGLLQHQVFWEGLRRIAQVQASEHCRRRGRHSSTHRRSPRHVLITVDPKHAGAAQLVVTQRIGSARIARARIPYVFGEDRALTFAQRLTIED